MLNYNNMREIQDHKDFSICSWYGPFEHITPKTVILELSEAVLKCFLFEEPSEDDSSEDSDGEETPLPGEFKEKLKNAFNTLGKTVFVKNNWHAPIDAKMFSTGNTLKAESADDIKLFFTTSTVIQKDLFNIKGIPFCLALRKWISIHPAAEFRCIVVNDTLRDVVDIVLSYPDKPFILDFGPLNSRTNLYAFSWKEIGPLLNKDFQDEIAPVFRYLECDIGIMIREDALKKFRPKV
ncbi:hypothetical protein HUJ05_003185 [Dendroctonus ponderosae]|nr:hypothetical protein HUJ05_003185 [Dendroctonus ponderosae]